MGVPTPKWHSLLEGHAELDTTAARQNLSGNIRHVEQDGVRIILTTYAQPRAAMVSLRDIALLRVLDDNPELMKQARALLPS